MFTLQIIKHANRLVVAEMEGIPRKPKRKRCTVVDVQ